MGNCIRLMTYSLWHFDNNNSYGKPRICGGDLNTNYYSKAIALLLKTDSHDIATEIAEESVKYNYSLSGIRNTITIARLKGKQSYFGEYRAIRHGETVRAFCPIGISLF